MKNELPDDQLHSLLREWKVDAEPHPRFSEGVWRRIAQGEAESSPWITRWRRWMSLQTGQIGVAWGAAAAVIITVGAAWFGHATAAPDAATPSASSYLASVDPYRMTP